MRLRLEGQEGSLQTILDDDDRTRRFILEVDDEESNPHLSISACFRGRYESQNKEQAVSIIIQKSDVRYLINCLEAYLKS